MVCALRGKFINLGRPFTSDFSIVIEVSYREEIIGLLLVKELIVVDKSGGVRAGDIRLRGLPYLEVDQLIDSLYKGVAFFSTWQVCFLF